LLNSPLNLCLNMWYNMIHLAYTNKMEAGNLDVKLMAIDMDGTLLNSRNEISQRTKETIEKASNAGVKIVLATGRLLRSAINYSEILGLRKPIIASNGAVMIDEDRNKLYEGSINMNIVEKVMDIGEKNNIYYHFYDEDTFYSNVYIEEVIQFYESRDTKEENRIKFNIFEEKQEIIENKDLNIYKFLFLDEDIYKLNLLRDELNNVDEINVCSSWNNNIEVMGREVSKGTSLKNLCKELNILPEEVITIGDNENDISMLNYAGMGVAMGNAEEEVKEIADIITLDNDEDGVAEIIDKYVLKIGEDI